jgi:branched-subunit amino acid aminotransferase/4-amino-4-deoxychorismate lyase
MSEPIVYLNDGFVPASKAHLNIYDLGIVLGATLTEMTRTFGHQPFRLEDHLRRLYRSCKYAGITLPLTIEDMLQKSRELIEANASMIGAAEELGIVHFVTPGENRIYAGSAAGGARLTPTVCVHSFPLPFHVWKHLFTEGAHVVTPAIRHVPPQCLDPRMKNRSRLHWWLADNQTHAVDPKAITLLLDLDGNITECAGSNFITVVGRRICSPSAKNILEGISLVTIREMAPELGLEWVEKDLQPYDVVNADEAMLTTTPYCAAPCTRINTIAVGNGKPGPVWRQVIEAWSRRVGMDVLAQIINSSAPATGM